MKKAIERLKNIERKWKCGKEHDDKALGIFPTSNLAEHRPRSTRNPNDNPRWPWRQKGGLRKSPAYIK